MAQKEQLNRQIAMTMTCGEIWNITRDIIKPEELADLLLQTYWEANGHEGNIKDLEAYPKAKERLMHHLNLFVVKQLADAAQGAVRGLEYGKYCTGKYQYVL